MNVFLLDIDHLGIVQRGSAPEHPTLTGRMREHSLDVFFVSIVGFHEQVNGWNAYIRRARGLEGVVRGYAMFQDLLANFDSANILPFDTRAAEAFAKLRQSGVRVGTMDFRIGSSALVHGFTLLTRNTVDFDRIPGLPVEDWTLTDDPT